MVHRETNPFTDLPPTGEVGSVGSLGIEARSNERYVLTSPWGADVGIDSIERTIRMGIGIIDRHRPMNGSGSEPVTRCCGRFLVRNEVIDQIAQSHQLLSHIEVAIPIALYNGNSDSIQDRVWLTVLAVNHPSRQSILPIETMIGHIQQDQTFLHESPVSKVQTLRQYGYEFIQTMTDYIEEIADLWGSTFDWTQDGVISRNLSIQHELNLNPNLRSSWFSGLVDPDGRIISVAVAERLDLPVGDGSVLPLIELSEWSCVPTSRSRGCMSATNAYLISQVLHDLSGMAHAPVLFAETNFMSNAHRVAFASGMSVPTVGIGDRHIPQILVQNVAVGDGFAPVGRRDFTVAYLSTDSIELNYTTAQCEAILGVDDRRSV